MLFELKWRSSQMNLPCQNKQITVIPLSPRLFCKKTWQMLEGWMTVSLVKLLWKKSWTTQILVHGKPSFRQTLVLWFHYPEDLETFDVETETGITECHIINNLLTELALAVVGNIVPRSWQCGPSEAVTSLVLG